MPWGLLDCPSSSTLQALHFYYGICLRQANVPVVSFPKIAARCWLESGDRTTYLAILIDLYRYQ